MLARGLGKLSDERLRLRVASGSGAEMGHVPGICSIVLAGARRQHSRVGCGLPAMRLAGRRGVLGRWAAQGARNLFARGNRAPAVIRRRAGAEAWMPFVNKLTLPML